MEGVIKAAAIHEGDPPREWRQPALRIAAAVIQNKVMQNRYFYTIPREELILADALTHQVTVPCRQKQIVVKLKITPPPPKKKSF